jgi:hypothetical protein
MAENQPTGELTEEQQRIRESIIVELARSLSHAYIHFFRIIDYAGKSSAAKGDDWESIDDSRRLSALSRAEEDALLIALNRTTRLIQRAKAHRIVGKDFARRLVRMSDAVRIVRDVREHLDEYITGKGSNREKVEFRFAIGEGKFITVPANWSFSYQGRQTIGGRVALEDVSESMVEIYDQMQAEGLWQLPWTPTQLIDDLKAYTPARDDPEAA